MAPIEPDLTNSNLVPIVYFTAYLVTSTCLVTFVTRNIYKSYVSLPPSQDTRWREANRRRHTRIFVGLACLSVAHTMYHLAQVLLLSYKLWAHDMGQSLPAQPYTRNSFDELMLGRWLNQVSPLSVEAWEIVIESSTRFWWTQQVFLGTVPWAVYVGIEGRRRNIRHLWAYLVLGPLISRAFALNMFFLAVLATPVPQAPKEVPSTQTPSSQPSGLTRHSSSRISTLLTRLKSYSPGNTIKPNPPNWHPSPSTTISQSLVIYAFLVAYPSTLSTTLFRQLIPINFIILPCLIYPQIFNPLSFGSTTYTPAELASNRLLTARFFTITSLVLSAKQTVLALLSADPGPHTHRHSAYLAALHLPHEAERTPLHRSGAAVAGVLGPVHNHPATARLGYDVLLCGLSLIVWAGVRGVDVEQLLATVGVGSGRSAPRRDAGTHAATKPKRKRKASSVRGEKDGTYQPQVEGESDVAVSAWVGEEEKPESGEAAALAAVGFVLGGLGVASALVLGAEEI